MQFIIISGLSGAGKSQAASFLEDMGFFCVDNMPVQLIPKFAELSAAGISVYERVVVVTDIRSGANFDQLFAALDTLAGMRCKYQILFIEADNQTIIKRYKETRRTHPLQRQGSSLEHAVEEERKDLQPVRERADYIIDTTNLPTAKLRSTLIQTFGNGENSGEMNISVVSFGFKYGLPMEADLVFDVRFLPNPFYVEELKHLTGLDEPVREFIFHHKQAQEFMDKLEDMIDYLLPHYIEEGKTALVIAIGCTGGHHRSVAVTRALCDHLKQNYRNVSENHRDMTRG